jgi:Flp pilus assembly protein TadD
MECTPRRRRTPAGFGLIGVLAAIGLAGCVATKPSYVLHDQADHHLSLGQHEEAAAAYAEILENYPGDWKAQYGLGACSNEIGDYRTARRSLETAHALRPQDEDIVDELCRALLHQDDTQALNDLLAEECNTRQSVRAHLRKARYMIEVHDMDSAKVSLETAMAIDAGKSVEPYLEAAEFAEAVGNLELAIRRLRQAYGISPRDDRVSERLIALGEVPGPTLALPPGV